MRIWLHWEELDEHDRPLGIADYQSVGTMNDAISRHADEIYEKLGGDGKRICEKLFKIITGKGSDNKGIRYPSNVKTIKAAVSCTGEALFKVIE